LNILAFLSLFSLSITHHADLVEWVLQDDTNDLSVKEFEKGIENEELEIILIDVRTPDEFTSERIEGAINIDFRNDDFKERIKTLDKERTYYLYCGSGTRSAGSMVQMNELGIDEAYHLDGGLKAWKAAGKQVTKSNSIDN